MVHIAATMMVKNERKRIHVTLESIKDTVSSLIIFDTGSDDDTIKIISDFCDKHNIPLHLSHGTFVDFSTSRNELLTFADTIQGVDYLLLLDCNDELRNGLTLIEHAKEYLNNDKESTTAFFIAQRWYYGNPTDLFYKNIRLLKPNKGWMYKFPVHEYLENTTGDNSTCRFDDVTLFQDRTKDDDKSLHRFSRDKDILLKYKEDHPDSTRATFYLAQTFECLKDTENTFKYYKERSTMEGFYEERYLAFIRAGNNSPDVETSLHLWSNAYKIMKRAEPLILIAKHYLREKNFDFTFIFSNLA